MVPSVGLSLSLSPTSCFQKKQKPVATPSLVIKKLDASLTKMAVLTEVKKTEKELEFGTCHASNLEKESEKSDLGSVDRTHNPLLDKEVQSQLTLLFKTRSQADLEQPLPV